MVKLNEHLIFGTSDLYKFEKASLIMRALAHPLRLKILAYIDKNKTVQVNKIYNALNLEQSITSQHLKVLRSANLVITKRQGKFIYYAINYEFITTILQLIDRYSIK